MSTTAITMDELESEHAELLPSRETLCCYRPHPCGGPILAIDINVAVFVF